MLDLVPFDWCNSWSPCVASVFFSFESFFSWLLCRSLILNNFYFTGFRVWLGVGWFDFFNKKSSNNNPQFIFNIFINSLENYFLIFWHLINSNEFCSKKLERFDYWLLLTVCWVFEFLMLLSLNYFSWGSLLVGVVLGQPRWRLMVFSKVSDPIPLDCMKEQRNLDEDCQSRWFKPVL